ncbi:MAG: NAD(P)H-quinone oxidoreductase [Chloroflexi bacterium]|nr:NAD(P)H-quinone oxidoreductase [Chloroflexota bacterium]
MRAAVVTEPGGPEVFKVIERDDPAFGPDEVLVDVKASALNRADLSQRRGNYPAPPGIPQDIPGLEMSGVVAAVGDRVTSLREGDRVFGLIGGGGYATRVNTHERMAMPIPAGMSFTDAASIPEVFFTAYDALFTSCNLVMGESTLIHAAGSGIGIAAIQLARHAGAITYATASSPDKLARAAELGLDVGINYREEDFLEVIRERTGGRGVDVVLDVIGAPYWENNLNSLAVRGRIVLVGAMGGSKLETDLRILGPKRLRVHGTVLRARPLEEKIALSQQIQKRVVPLFEAGDLKPVVDRIFPLEETGEAHAYMETNANFGKIILSME